MNTDEYLYGGPRTFWDMLWPRLIGWSPILTVCLVCLVVSMILAARHRRAGVLASIAFGALLLTTLASMAGQSWMSWKMWEGDAYETNWPRVMGYFAFAATVIHALCYGVLTWAVFAGRRSAEAGHGAAHPMTPAPVPEGGAGGAHASVPPVAPAGYAGGDRVPPPAGRISKGVYLTCIYGAGALSTVLSIPIFAALIMQEEDLLPVAFGSLCGAMVFSVLVVVMMAVLWYKLWATIRDGDVRTTPGKAVGFGFIPFFNLYWVFVLIRGWAIDFNRYASQRGIPSPRAMEGLGLALCVMTVASAIPYLGVLVGVAAFIPSLLFMNRAIDCANAVRATRAHAHHSAM